ncbi:MAG: DUF2971 domain-containing protein [Gammaproteobacteria bacterium]
MENKPDKLKLPEVLFQYRPPELWALENLSRQVIHFTSPEKFNDPYDCNIPPMLSRLPDAGFARLAKMWPDIRKKHGVACLSACNDNLLMWSHYAGRGKGFCLAFEVNDIDESILAFGNHEVMPVKYEKNNPSATDIEIWKAGEDKWGKLFLHKSEDWKYEQEWRLVKGSEGEEKYWAAWLKAIYFGTGATDGMKEIIRSIVEETYPDTELWEGELSKTEYKVVFHPYQPKRA